MARDIIVEGAGILGLWQALALARDGHRVRLVDRAANPLETSASAQAGAMLAPDCEAEATPAIVRNAGRDALNIWIATVPGIVRAGTLVTALPRDLPDLDLFARKTDNHRTLDTAGIAAIEPELADRFQKALYFSEEAHLVPPTASAFLLDRARASGVAVEFGETHHGDPSADALVVDCRGLAARDILPDLRGVRGERLLLNTPEVTLMRPVRLLHPRHPIYVVPWGEGRFLLGATMIESEDGGPITVRSALDLLAAAYALVPAFGEAQILEATSGLRPAFPDNVPRARVLGPGRIAVNGAYRHGWLLAPILAEAVADYLRDGRKHPLITA
ncbi:MAG: FAD-dependent oxidoreductase [Hyphomicrobium sp.]|nr:FAD-dependent oxidoreductase [Hyphomicrobium sp.]